MLFSENQLEVWLNNTKKDNRLILTDKNFCQFQLKKRIGMLIEKNPPLILTLNQWLNFLLQLDTNRSKFLINDFKASYIFNDNEKSFLLYNKLNKHNFLPWQSIWPEHFFCIFDCNKIKEYHKKFTNSFDQQLLLNELIKNKSISHKWKILIATNKAFTEKQNELIKSYAHTINYLVNFKEPAKITHKEYPDEISETHQTINEVISHHEKKPDDIIGIVTSSYNKSREIYQILKNLNQDNIILNTIYSAPEPLIKIPLIKKALWLINQIISDKIEIDIWLHYFSTNQLISNDNKEEHTQLIKTLYTNPQINLYWSDLKKLKTKNTNSFYEKLKYCRDIIYEKKEDNLYEWTIKFEKILTCWYWLGASKLSTNQIEIIHVWNKAINNLNTLTEKNMSPEKALVLLKKACKSLNFQHSQNIKNPKIYIINHQELASGFYDKIWAIGFNTDSWPLSEKFNFVLPKNLNNNLEIFNESYKKLQIINLKHSSKIIQSSHCSNVDNKTKYMSNFLTDKIIKANSYNIYQKELNKKLTITKEKEYYKNNKISATLLKDLNTCQFKGLAKHIFKISSLEKKENDISPKIKGQIIHESLAKIWETIKSQETLINMKKEDLNNLTYSICKKIVFMYSSHYAWPLDNKKTICKIKLITNQLLSWLDLEKQRPWFKVKFIEYDTNLIVDDTILKLRLDRIDETKNGLVIIDYKTGLATINDWLGERPDNPQMLLYFLSISPQPSSLVYALINNKKLNFSGLSTHDWPNNKLNEQFETLTLEWKRIILKNINKAKTIYPILNPKHKEKCKNCEIKKLCRIYEIINEN